MSKSISYINLSHPQIIVVNNISELLTAKFTQASNVILYRRAEPIKGNFNGLAQALLDTSCNQEKYYYDLNKLQQNEGCSAGGSFDLWKKSLDFDGDIGEAYRTISSDAQIVKQLIKRNKTYKISKLALRFVQANDGKSEDGWHYDGADPSSGRMMMAYNNPTEGVYDEDVVEYQNSVLKDVQLLPNAKPFEFKPGDIWRHNHSFVHRAPIIAEPRVLLVVDFY